MSYIPDPIERMEARMERQMDLVDADGNYPCAVCGKKCPVDEMYTVTEDPSSALQCYECFNKEMNL